MQILRFQAAKTSQWSGGETHEIRILPLGSDFKLGDYDLRISVATVKVEKSEFTTLPDVKRTLCVLEGHLTLNHQDHHQAELSAFQQDSFRGDWKTTSEGQVTDFNVMWKTGNALVEHKHISEGQTINLDLKRGYSLVFIGAGRMKFGDQVLEKYDAIEFNENIELTAFSTCDLLVVNFNNGN